MPRTGFAFGIGLLPSFVQGTRGGGLAQGIKKFSLWLFVLALSLFAAPSPPHTLPLSLCLAFYLCLSVALC